MELFFGAALLSGKRSSLQLHHAVLQKHLAVGDHGGAGHDEVVVAGGLDGTAQRDTGADADVHRALHAFVLQHEAAEVALGVEAHPHLGDVVDVGVGLAGKVIFEHLRLAAALDGGDAPVLDMADHRLLQHADADIGDAGVGDDDAVGGALQRGDVGLDGGDGGNSPGSTTPYSALPRRPLAE